MAGSGVSFSVSCPLMLSGLWVHTLSMATFRQGGRTRRLSSQKDNDKYREKGEPLPAQESAA